MTYRECYSYGLDVLTKSEVADAGIDARLLLEFVCGTSRHDMLLHGDREVSSEQFARYEAYILKRSSRIPLQHITGEQAFMGFDFKVNEHVLIPRQDTEVLVEEALKVIEPGMDILDMCTGSGCILLSLLALSEGCRGIGVDISGKALKTARINHLKVAEQCGKNLQAVFTESDLFAGVEGRFDMIVSNPPYIASAVIDTLEPEVRLHEPIGALDGTPDGLFFYKKIVTECKAYLKKGAALLFEIGHDQGQAVSSLMKEAGFFGVTVRKDYAGLDRVVYGFYEEEA